MPADVQFALAIGAGGLNLRDQPVTVPPSELIDSVNWELDEHGALVKRLGYVTYPDSLQLAGNPLEMTTYRPSGGEAALLIACDNGHVYSSPGDGTYTSIASGLSTTAAPAFVQMNDVMYWGNGVDALHSWDGTTLTAISGQDDVQTISITGTPTSGYFALSFNGATTAQTSDIQTVSMTGTVTAGTFTLTFNGQTTTSLNWNATLAQVQSALEALSSIGSGNITCQGGPFPTGAITYTFAGTLANQSQPLMTASNSLTGGGVQVSHTVTGVGLAYNSTAAQVQSALQALFPIGTSNILCTGGPLPGSAITCTFAGTLANNPQPVITHTQLFGGGSSPALSVTHTTTGQGDAPQGRYVSVWQDCLCISGDPNHPHRFYWSAIGDPTNWPPNNFVDLFGPRGDVITGMTTAQNLGISSDGSDGVLVFERRAMHRVIDISQNVLGVVQGGANVLVDSSTGTVSNRSIATVNGRIYCVGVDGIYSTDGHRQLHLESSKVTRLFQNGLNPVLSQNFTALSYQNKYRLAATKSGDQANSLVIDVYTNLPKDKGDGDFPVMVQALPVQSWAVYPGSTGDTIFFADSTVGQTAWIRQLDVGGTDTTNAIDPVTITASAKTGASFFGTEAPKRMRRVIVEGRGTLNIGVSSDLDQGVGESQTFTLDIPTVTWGTFTWGSFTWGAAGVSTIAQRWYTRRGRLFQFSILDNSTSVGETRAAVGAPAAPAGGAAVYSLLAWIIPLNADN